MSQCLNPNCSHQNPENTKFCQRCGSQLKLRLRYRATRILGQGGFGRTFLALDEDKPKNQTCVIKQFFPQAQGTNTIKKAAEMFEREAEQLDELGKYPQIPELLAYFTEGGYQYLVQEYIDGQDLDKILETQGKFSEKQIRDILQQILPILQHLHERNVIHRDIKPENIIRRGDGKLILVDFGAAKQVASAAFSVTGTTIGSAGYVSPEQAVGKAKPNSDIYSLGATCVRMLTQIEPSDLYDAIIDEAWRDFLDTPIEKQLGDILDNMLVVAVKKRYQSAG
ncbi:serine/threonine-protein kinase, partial [Geitlerinema sp. PCC 9228]|uniref:serine/threonine-protein kinase n=1 Tax=Geitlerinema sp. PCC 9228 TaxID=111611 RepID=UPI000B0D7BEB